MKQQMISLKTKVVPVLTPKVKQVSPGQANPMSPSSPKYHLKRESPWLVLKRLEEKEKRSQQMLERNMMSRPIVNIQYKKTSQDLKKGQTNPVMRTKNRLPNKVISKPVPMGYLHVHVHPDETFFSGAWLFDMSSAPHWFQIEVQKKNQRASPYFKNTQGMQGPLQPTRAYNKQQAPIYNPVVPREAMSSVSDEENVFALLSWLKSLNQVASRVHNDTVGNFKQNNIYQHPIHPNSQEEHKNSNSMVTTPRSDTRKSQQIRREYSTIQSVNVQKYHPDDDFYSGAWLFNPDTQCPGWLQQELHVPFKEKKEKFYQKHPIQQRNIPSTLQMEKQHTPKMKMSPIQEIKRNQTGTNNMWTQMKMLPIEQKKIKPKDAKDTPIQGNRVSYIHPDTVFHSGAWLFDSDDTPLWLAKELLPIKPVSALRSSFQKKMDSANHHQKAIQPQSPDIGFESGAWLFDMDSAPDWLQHCLVPKSEGKLTLPSKKTQKLPFPFQKLKIKEQPEGIFFESGIWLFHPSEAPQWFQELLNSKVSQKQLIKMQR